MMGVLVENWEQTRRFSHWKPPVCGLEIILKNLPVLSLILLWEFHSLLSQGEGLPVVPPSIWSLYLSAGSSHTLAAGVTGRCSRAKLLPSEFFSPKVTLATRKSPLHWDGWKTPGSPEGVRWEFTTSGILILTQALPASQHSIVRAGQAVLVRTGVMSLSQVSKSWAAVVGGMCRNPYSG